MTRILVTKPGVLNQRDRARLRRAGIVTIEAESPSDVKLIEAGGMEVPASDMFYAALTAINSDHYNGNTRETFTKALLSAMDHVRAEYAANAEPA